MSDLTVVVLAFNEAESLRILLPGYIQFCTRNDYELIVINDGSEDEKGTTRRHSRY